MFVRYHFYPARFNSSLIRRILKDLSRNSNCSVTLDPFGGCGTVNLESKLLGIESIGVDINPLSKIIADTKITPIYPRALQDEIMKLQKRIKPKSFKTLPFKIKKNPIVQYWFPKKSQKELYSLLVAVNKITSPEIRRFFLCAFSNILKKSSIWLAKSTKPHRDPEKKIQSPLILFRNQVEVMGRENHHFYEIMRKNDLLKIKSKFTIGDARKLPLRRNSIDYIITSPPYFIAHEYADIHQLSLAWIFGINNLRKIKKEFIGTNMIRGEENGSFGSSLASITLKRLENLSTSYAKRASQYFSDMLKSYSEMYRVLRPKGIAVIVIGNTICRGIKIKNSLIAQEQLESTGFRVNNVRKRPTANQSITPYRDKRTGRFTSKENPNARKSFASESIMFVRKN